ncbi:MAG TPA: hypothetical protein VLK30_09175 [Candidatus Limnocylindrales bacterium]|nr:hypothetical protein [Candidatus Limnocylindrales bacterium]
MTGGPPGQPYPYLPPTYNRPEAQYATPSMVLGIISLCVLPLGCCCGIGELIVVPLGVAALALGFAARSKITASQGALGGEGKALAGIITGGTATAIAIVLFVVFLLLGVATRGIVNGIPTPSG